jgi:transglutaminase-like putative cysteine protease
MNPRLTITAAAAVVLASVSIYPLIAGGTWFWAGAGAVITAAAAGTVTRLPAVQAGLAGTVVALLAAAPLLASPVWGWKVLGVVVVAAAAAASWPRVRAGQLLGVPVTYLAGLLIYLNVSFAARWSVAGVVPTTTSVRYLWTLAGQGLAERAYAPPVPSTLGITLLAAGGIGLMAAATDLLAVRLRSPAIAGLPLLALYSVRITTNARQGGAGATVVFCLGMAGYLALLAADGRDRLRIWGRLVTVWHNPLDDHGGAPQAPDTRALAASGRRIGLAAACIALAFPLLIPGVRVHDLFASAGTGTGTGSGGGQIRLPDPLVQMNTQLQHSSQQIVLTYHTNAARPAQQYLQVYVLNYDPLTQRWTLVPPQGTQVGGGALRAAPGVARGVTQTRTTTQVRLSTGVAGYSSRLAVLPLPYAPAALSAPGSWEEDNTSLMVYSTSQQLSGLTYTVTSTQPSTGGRVQDLAPQYPASIKDGYLSFPAGRRLTGQLKRLAAGITRRARTPFAKAVALQDYFTTAANGFTYNLGATLPDSLQGLTQFLFRTKSGYCQQFAFAMAALAREIGIPSRIAVGYTAGQPGGNGMWKVTAGDAHAWPELYFRDVGWLRFEPTPGGRAGQGTATAPNYAPPPNIGASSGSLPTGSGAGSRSGGRLTGPNLAHLHGEAGIGPGGAARAASHSIVPQILLIVAIVLGLALITPMAARWLIRRGRLRLLGRYARRHGGGLLPDRDPHRDAELAHAAWSELRDNLADFGLASRVSESPRGLAGRVATTLHLDPASREALDRIVKAEERARYATAPLGPGTLRADTAALRRALSREADWPARWRAWLLPASTLTPIRRGLQLSLDVFGWMDVAGLRLRDRIRPQG